MSAEFQLPRPFALGLVIGKFAPLHRGHEWLIEQAARQCDRLLILSYCNPEFPRCEPAARRRWLLNRAPKHETFVIDPQWLEQRCALLGVSPMPVPENTSSDETQQQFLTWLLQVVVQRRPDAMFCSEPYGTACANLLSGVLDQKVTPIIVDLARSRFPVSGTQIRANPYAHRDWMAPVVRASFILRIAILGGESSGKTTLAEALAAHFETAWVQEYGREFWEKRSGQIQERDLLEIAEEQIRREEAGAEVANRFLFCDTSPLTTAGYGGWMFGRVLPDLETLANRTYDAIILCQPDFPFVQDGTRRDEEFRLKQHHWYQEQLRKSDCPIFEIGGAIANRISSVANWMSKLRLD